MSSRRDQEFSGHLTVEDMAEPYYNMDTLHFCSDERGDVRDLPFTAEDFTAACLRAANGPFTYDNEHFTRVAWLKC
jgi:hypothetical protein